VVIKSEARPSYNDVHPMAWDILGQVAAEADVSTSDKTKSTRPTGAGASSDRGELQRNRDTSAISAIRDSQLLITDFNEAGSLVVSAAQGNINLSYTTGTHVQSTKLATLPDWAATSDNKHGIFLPQFDGDSLKITVDSAPRERFVLGRPPAAPLYIERDPRLITIPKQITAGTGIRLICDGPCAEVDGTARDHEGRRGWEDGEREVDSSKLPVAKRARLGKQTDLE
jgi:hypothetical protein